MKSGRCTPDGYVFANGNGGPRIGLFQGYRSFFRCQHHSKVKSEIASEAGLIGYYGLMPTSFMSSALAHIRQSLREGDVEGLNSALSKLSEPLDLDSSGRESMFTAALFAPQASAWNRLCEHSPSQCPTPDEAYVHLGVVLGRHPLWMADWLVEKTGLCAVFQEHVNRDRKPMAAFMQKALLRSDDEGIQWLAKPPFPMAAWQDDFRYPALWDLLSLSDRSAAFVTKAQSLLSSGAFILLRPDAETYGQISPLGALVREYVQKLDTPGKFPKVTAAQIEAIVVTLWSPLVAAGDDPYGVLGNATTVLDVIQASPLAPFGLGWEREQALKANASPENSAQVKRRPRA